MSAPRTIKASEVRKGMRVRWEIQHEGATITTEGEATLTSGTRYASEIVLGDYRAFLDPDHPVTVLADPEPELVEGAWYWVEFGEDRTLARRVAGGWSIWRHDDSASWRDDDQVTVLGRVLIVDWPGDEAVQLLTNAYRPGVDWSGVDWECSLLQSLADAIRAQGGVR